MLYNIQVIYNYYNILIYTNLPQNTLRCASIICKVLKTTKPKVCLTECSLFTRDCATTPCIYHQLLRASTFYFPDKTIS